MRNTNKVKTMVCPDQQLENAQLQEILDWLDENPQVNACRDYANLQFFLRTCKFDVERTKQKLCGFYKMRAERVEWFSKCDPFLPELQELLTLGVFLPIDGVDVNKRKVIVIRTSAHNPKLHTQNNVFKISKMILDLLLKLEPDNCAQGIVAILDMNGVQLGHALQFNKKLIKNSVESWTAYPCQPKLLEFINTPLHVNIILNTFRLFMTPKMRSRVFVRRQCATSVKCEQLPQDIGGNGKSYKELAIKWKRLVEENIDFYIKQEKYKSILN